MSALRISEKSSCRDKSFFNSTNPSSAALVPEGLDEFGAVDTVDWFCADISERNAVSNKSKVAKRVGNKRI
jgi:hypothetical protein